MSKSDEIQMRLTLRGPRAEVSAVLLLAVENGLVASMDTLDPEPVATAPKARSNGRGGRPFNPGQHVVVSRDRVSVYPAATVGRRGAVVRSVKRGKGYGVEVRWDDAPSEVTGVASTILKATNPR